MKSLVKIIGFDTQKRRLKVYDGSSFWVHLCCSKLGESEEKAVKVFNEVISKYDIWTHDKQDVFLKVHDYKEISHDDIYITSWAIGTKDILKRAEDL